MTRTELEAAFPGLSGVGFRVTSPSDVRYNCLAWAVGDTRQWWQPLRLGGYYWPSGVDRDDSIEAWTAVLRLHGYRECAAADLEPDVEKVAIYVGEDGLPAHIARQLPSGWWTSKLGSAEDIEHPDLGSLEGHEYGQVRLLLSRHRI